MQTLVNNKIERIILSIDWSNYVTHVISYAAPKAEGDFFNHP